MCLSELERRCNCLPQTASWLQKGTALIWCGYFIALIKQTLQPVCFLVYFILTPASLWLLSANTTSLKSAQLILCPKLVLQFVGNPSFSHVFSSQAEFCPDKEYGAALCCWPFPSWALALAPSHSQALQVISAPLRLISPHSHISHLDYFHLQRVTCLGMCWYHHSEHFSYCLEAAKVTYKCKYSWVLLNLSTTWEQRSSASVRGCLDFSSRTQP